MRISQQHSVYSTLMGLSFLVLMIAFTTSGCGTVEESADTSMENTWTQPAPAVNVARLEYRIDSLMTENRRLKQQLDAMAQESQNLASRNSELESRLNEALATPKAPPPPADFTSAYSAALAEYRKRNFTGAAAQFESLLKSGIKEDLADNCHYWIGESYYGTGKFNDAMEHFQMVFNYVKSEKKDDAQMMIGNCYVALRNNAAAKTAFNKLISTYTTSAYVARAQEKLATLK
ncbi:MAG: tetratricopeptide repeat protein [Bacteroidota bacterium]